MKSLNDLRAEHGWFIFPEPEELRVAIDRIDRRIKRLMPENDLAGYALSDGEGYRRRVRSFDELLRPELVYVESWTLQADLRVELARLGWLPEPTPERIARLLKEDPDIPLRTRDKLLERYLPHVR